MMDDPLQHVQLTARPCYCLLPSVVISTAFPASFPQCILCGTDCLSTDVTLILTDWQSHSHHTHACSLTLWTLISSWHKNRWQLREHWHAWEGIGLQFLQGTTQVTPKLWLTELEGMFPKIEIGPEILVTENHFSSLPVSTTVTILSVTITYILGRQKYGSQTQK